MNTIRLGTRRSPLALAQTEAVRDALLAIGVEQVEIVAMETSGDLQQTDAIAQWGYKGLFTKEIEEALLDKRIDIAVHSMKDMPSELPGGLMLAAMLPREDVRDAFICEKAERLEDLPEGATVGTASSRRGAQLRHIRPDLNIIDFRGRVETRLRKLNEGQADATLLATAGLNRLGLQQHITQPLDIETMLPAIGQAAVGMECRSDDAATRALLDQINHTDTFNAVTCERVLLNRLDGSCKTPMAGYAMIKDGHITLRGEVLAPDGSVCLKGQAEGELEKLQEIGEAVADHLIQLGAKELMHG